MNFENCVEAGAFCFQHSFARRKRPFARGARRNGCIRRFWFRRQNSRFFFSKSVKKSVKRGVRASHARLSPVSLSVFSFVPDLLFDCSRVLEYAKIRTVLQSSSDLKKEMVPLGKGRWRASCAPEIHFPFERLPRRLSQTPLIRK